MLNVQLATENPLKKSLNCLVAITCLVAGSAYAQSSVTLFGIVDAGLQIGRGSVADRTQLGNSGYNSSRLGFRGAEDLGGGMSASFWIETSVNNDNGTGQATNTNNQASGGAPAGSNGGQGLTFNRRSTVSLAGNWGEVRLGRDYVPQFWNTTVFDPFGTNGVGTNQVLSSIITGVTAVRASNSMGYFLPREIGGFYGQVQYYVGENPQTGAATEDDGSGYGVRAGYATGPLNVSFAIGKTRYAAGDSEQANIGASWDFGVAKIMGQIERDKGVVVAPVAGYFSAKGFVFGAQIPMGAGEIRAAISSYRTDAGPTEPTTRKLALGYVHNLSKRTALYGTYARVRNSGGASFAPNGAVTAANASASGLDLGLRHAF